MNDIVIPEDRILELVERAVERRIADVLDTFQRDSYQSSGAFDPRMQAIVERAVWAVITTDFRKPVGEQVRKIVPENLAKLVIQELMASWDINKRRDDEE